VFLASDKSRYITGATLEVTGRPLVFWSNVVIV
jgi:NAD(P)-dependent dehydrogenase (short-subunit alcohol dehydrogenase family)